MFKMSATRVFLISDLLASLASTIVFTTAMIYRIQTVGLDPLQLVLVGTVLEATIFIFEVPTGIVADVYSRRLSFIIGIFLTGIGLMVEGLAPLFWVILLSQFLWGFGWTFISGAHNAWITDEVGTDKVGDVFLQSRNASLIGALFAIPISVWAANISLALPYIVGGGLYLLTGIFNMIFMKETGFKPTPPEERETWNQLFSTAREGFAQVRGKSSLMTYALIALLVGLYSEGWDRLSDAHLLDNFVFPDIASLSMGTVEWFNLIRFVGLILGLLATQYVRKKLDTSDNRKVITILIWIQSGMVIAMTTFALTNNFVTAIILMIIFDRLRSLTFPLSNTWINQHIDSKVRATVLSMTGQVDAFGQMAGGPFIGAIGRLRDLRTAIVTAALVLAPTVPLYGKLKKMESKEK